MFRAMLPTLVARPTAPSITTQLRSLAHKPRPPEGTDLSTSGKAFKEALSRLTSPSVPRSKGTTHRKFPSIRYHPEPTSMDGVTPATSTITPHGKELHPSRRRYDTGVLTDDMPFLHFLHHDEKPKPKFKSPRKRASKLLNELQLEAVKKSKESKPAVWDVPFRVGDAIEIEMLDSGGVDNPENKRLDRVRGVVLGRENRGMDTSIYLKDVLFGEHVERKIKLHSPMVKTLKVLEKNFVHKGKKKVKRAKLYYLRDRKPEETRVTGIKFK